ncbi:MAG: (Fe-S)-binding protein [Clostridia bacterium]|nr:(Fe-S)-binding protein [Clostridia bacterium]
MQVVQKMYPDWIDEFKNREEAAAVPYRQPASLSLPLWFKADKWPEFKDPELINGIFRCQRCGICLSTKGCSAMAADPEKELATPRARIALIRALLEERISYDQIPPAVIVAGENCSHCGHCSQQCIVNVSYREKVSQEMTIHHVRLFRALNKTLRR